MFEFKSKHAFEIMIFLAIILIAVYAVFFSSIMPTSTGESKLPVKSEDEIIIGNPSPPPPSCDSDSLLALAGENSSTAICCGDDSGEFPICASGNVAELEVDEFTTFLAHYNTSVIADYAADPNSRTPSESSGVNFNSIWHGNGFRTGILVNEDDKLFYPLNSSIIDKDKGSIEMWISPLWNWDVETENHHFFAMPITIANELILSSISENPIICDGLCSWTMLNNSRLGKVNASINSWRALEWHHIALTWGDNRKLYVDGRLVDTDTYNGDAINSLPQNFAIGSYIYQGQATKQADATIDELRISNIQRSDEEIFLNYQKGRATSDCVCYNDPNALCKELIPETNNANENRFNIVFTGSGYDSSVRFKEMATQIINYYGSGNPGDRGLLSNYPFINYRDKFNVWYVNTIKPYNEQTFTDDWRFLASYCPQFSNIQILNIIDEFGGGYATFSSPTYGFIAYSTILGVDPDNFGFRHEFGHSFGGLMDEYVYGNGYGINGVFPAPNCSALSSTITCSNWCNPSQPTPLETFTQKNCQIYNDPETCNNARNNNEPCIWSYNNNSCTNYWNECINDTNQQSCESLNDGNDRDYCLWASELSSYFDSQCIPKSTTGFPPDLGLINLVNNENCNNSTACYYGCSANNWTRATYDSLMRNYTQEWGPVNENRLINYLETWLENPQLTAPDDLILFDFVDPKTNELSGGMIDLTKLDEIKNKQGKTLLQIMQQKQTKPIFENEIVQKQNINYDLLIEEYLKIQNS